MMPLKQTRKKENSTISVDGRVVAGCKLSQCRAVLKVREPRAAPGIAERSVYLQIALDFEGAIHH